MPLTSAEKMRAKRERDADDVRLQRLFEAGYALAPCPDGVTNDECVAWAKGVWKKQGELMEAERRNPTHAADDKPLPKTKEKRR